MRQPRDKYAHAAVHIYAHGKRGTGVIVSVNDGHILTAQHVVSGHSDAVIVGRTDDRKFMINAKVVGAQGDVALLKAQIPSDAVFVPPGDALPHKGSKVTVLGFGEDTVLDEGTYTVKRIKDNGISLVEMVRNGDSGAPVIWNGKVVGVLSSGTAVRTAQGYTPVNGAVATSLRAVPRIFSHLCPPNINPAPRVRQGIRPDPPQRQEVNEITEEQLARIAELVLQKILEDPAPFRGEPGAKGESGDAGVKGDAGQPGKSIDWTNIDWSFAADTIKQYLTHTLVIYDDKDGDGYYSDEHGNRKPVPSADATDSEVFVQTKPLEKPLTIGVTGLLSAEGN